MLKKTILFSLALLVSATFAKAQTADYYDGTNGLEGDDLKAALYEIIRNHTELEYGTIKNVIRQADEDPNDSGNVILMYTGNSIGKFDFASDPSNPDHFDFWNREHTWAKSHGNFGPGGSYGERGANTDAHHLRPVDMTVNSTRSNKDFDDGGSLVLNGGVETECYADSDSFEPRDEVKGDVARMIFYMATRYEGEENLDGDAEPDLEVVEAVNTFPNPEMGRLSTLLEWHNNDPVDDWERNRNDVIYLWQGNRNPFIDYPEFVNIIWDSETAASIYISGVEVNPEEPEAEEPAAVSADITDNDGASITDAKLYWGLNWAEVLAETNELTMTASGDNYSAEVSGQLAGSEVYYMIKATASDSDVKYFYGTYNVAVEPFEGELTSIYDIQGQEIYSPYAYEITDASGTQTFSGQGEVSAQGIVTAIDGDSFFMQDGAGAWNGIYVYTSGFFPQIGDEIIITGKIKEYYEMTEFVDVSAYYPISSSNELPEAEVISTAEVNTEEYESCLVKIYNATCYSDDLGFGKWGINDGTGNCNVANAVYNYEPTVGEAYDVSGVINFYFGEYQIETRFAADVQGGSDLIAPTITSVSSTSVGKLSVVFSEDVTEESIENISFYSISDGVVVTEAVQHSLQSSKVILSVLNQIEGELTITVNGTIDDAGNVTENDEFIFNSQYTNLSLEDNWINQLYTYPNPVTDNKIIIEGAEGADYVELYDATGRLLQSVSVNNSSRMILHTNNYHGIVMLRIVGANEVLHKRIIIE